MEKIYLDVPFFEKDEAKTLGAKWDGAVKRWFVTENDNITSFSKWITTPKTSSSLSHSKKQLHLDAHNQTQEGDYATLSQVMNQLTGVINRSFSNDIWVKCEVSEYNEHNHIYMKLVESRDGVEIASTQAIIFNQDKGILNTFFANTGLTTLAGSEILIRCKVNFHPKFGVSLSVKEINPDFTLGNIQKNINNIISSLTNEGIFEANRNLLQNWFFSSVAVIAPNNAASLGDFRREADSLEEMGICHFDYYYALFQGENSEPSILQQFDSIWQNIDAYDAVVIIRGGGAKNDLNYLNSYNITKKICLTPIPVLTGIGHETDNTTLDYVANIRFDTPSKVIKYIESVDFTRLIEFKNLHEDNLTLTSNVLKSFKSNLDNSRDSIRINSMLSIKNKHDVIERVNSYNLSKSLGILSNLKHNLDKSLSYIKEHSFFFLKNKKDNIKYLISSILNSSPQKTIARGFCYVSDISTKKAIPNAKSLDANKEYILNMKDGKIKFKGEPYNE